jgi:hypothetical protein
MPFGHHRENYYEGLNYPSVVKGFGVQITTTGLATLWTPASGKKFVLLGGQITVHVGVLLATQIAGDFVVLCDNALTAPIHNLGVLPDTALVAGSVLGTTQISDAAFAPAEDSTLASTMDHQQRFSIPGGYVSSTANNVLKAGVVLGDAGTVSTIGTGKMWFVGQVWGHEIN